MEGGLTIYNTFNTVQIDSKYRNYSFVRTRNLSTGEQDIPAPSSNPIMSALYSETGIMCVPAWSIGIFYSDYFYAVVGSGKFYDFEDIPVVPTHCGLNVYRADGSICYSSEMPPLRVLYAERGVLPDYNDRVLYSGVIAAGRKVAVILGQQPVVRYADRSSAPYHMRAKALKVTTNAAGFVEIKFTEYFSQVADVINHIGDGHYDFLIVDITGF